MRRGYRILREDQLPSSDVSNTNAERMLCEAETELIHLLKTRGISSICESISKEINYAWAVTSGFRTLSDAGNFYFACAGQIFGYNPGHDFFASAGMQLAVFALHKFLHNDVVLLPVLECIHIYTKLHVDGAVDFLAVDDSKEILMKCIRFHDNKHNIIAATCQALGSLVMNDLVKESISTPTLTLELVGLLKRYTSSLRICRAALVPLGFLVTDAPTAEVFIDNNGISIVMTCMKSYVADVEVVWHAIGVLNAVNTKVLDIRLIYAIYDFTGIPRIVEALACHLDTEEIAVEGFHLLSRLALIPDAYRIINKSKVLDLAYVALFAYSGPQHRHTRLEIKKTLYSFQKCTLHDTNELSIREQASRRDILLYALFVLTLLLTSALSPFALSSTSTRTLQQSIEEAQWARSSWGDRKSRRRFHDISRVDDVWSYLQGPLYRTLFASSWYNGDAFNSDVDTQLGMVGGSFRLIGGVQFRMLRVRNLTTYASNTRNGYPPYGSENELRSTLMASNGMIDRWTPPTKSDSSSKRFQGLLAVYPDTGYRVYLPRLSKKNVNNACGPKCVLGRLKDGNWIDESSRALFVEFNVFNPAEGVHGSVIILFEFNPTGGVLASNQITPVIMDRYSGLFIFSPLFYVEIALLMGVSWQLHKQVDKIHRYRLFYFIVPTHVADFLVIVFWVATIATRVGFHVITGHSQLEALAKEDGFVSIETDVHLQLQELTLTASCAFLMWWRALELTRRINPLERVLGKIDKIDGLIKSFFLLMSIYVVAFAHSGSLLFSTTSGAFSSFGTSIGAASKSLSLGWQLPESDSRGQVRAWQVLLRLFTFFVLLNLFVSTLRQRFEYRCPDTDSTVVPDGLSILDLARRQLKANGLPIGPISLSSRLRSVASRGLEWVKQTTHRLSATDHFVGLTEFRSVWGLSEAGTEVQCAGETVHDWTTIDGLLYKAEIDDRVLDERLSEIHMRCLDAMDRLEITRRLRQECRHAQYSRSSRVQGAGS